MIIFLKFVDREYDGVKISERCIPLKRNKLTEYQVKVRVKIIKARHVVSLNVCDVKVRMVLHTGNIKKCDVLKFRKFLSGKEYE